MKNLIISKCPKPTANCRAVLLLVFFLLVGSQCISRVRNLTTSLWSPTTAIWRGVFWSESLHIGSQCFSAVRNFTMSTCPFTAAQWSGVCLFSSKHDGLQPCWLIKYLTICRWPNSAASWRRVLPYWPGIRGHSSDQRWRTWSSVNVHSLLLDMQQCFSQHF